MNIVAIAGPIGSGKSFLANRFVNELGYVKLSFADALKEQCAEYRSYESGWRIKLEDSKVFFGWTGKDWTGPKSPEARAILQQVGIEECQKDKDVWIKKLAPKLAQFPRVVIDDARMINEINWIIGRGGRFFCLEPRKPEPPVCDHPSETEWRAYAYATQIQPLDQESIFRIVAQST